MEKIKPAFLENLVPICFSANDKYADMLATEIASIIENSSSKNNYDIVVFVSQMSEENQQQILSLAKKHSNFSIRFVDVSAYFSGCKFYLESDITNTKYSDDIYFRVIAPTIMREYNHIIFLDADLVVLDDIAELLKSASDQHLISAVRDYEGISHCYKSYERTKYRINEIGITNFDDYFISGVIVMNTQKFNEQFDFKTLLDLAVSKNWKQFDQDLLNFVCKDSVNIIDSKWDFVEDTDNFVKTMPKRLLDEYISSETEPKIIHFSGERKPWIRTWSKYNKYFWEYAKLTPYLSRLKLNLEQY